MSWFLSRLTGRGVFVALLALLAAFVLAWALVEGVPVLFVHLVNLVVKGQL